MFVSWKSVPFVRLVAPLAAGIVLQHYHSRPPGALVWTVGVLAALLYGAGRLPLQVHFSYRWLRGLLFNALLAAVGALLLQATDLRHSARYFARELQPGSLLMVTVKEPLQEKAKSYSTKAQVTGVVTQGRVLPAKGTILLYLQKSAAANALRCGHRLLLCNRLQAIRGSGNPGAFDYAAYCALQQIFHQAYLRQGQWRQLPGQDGGMLTAALLRARDYCLGVLQQYIGGKEAGLAAALLIGYRYNLDPEMVQDYTNTGIVHIIAISGMHLALIYGSLLWLLRWWPPHRFSEAAKALLIIALLWAFTLLTGASASVLRATVMFTFITVGRFMLNRYTNVYNTLAASAFALLCWQPRLLMDAGFQLSYLAVLSILAAYRPLYNCLYLPNRWVNMLWEAVALTLAAQLLTLPACLYYFQQFPLLFLPANLLAVPLSTIILYGVILLLALGCWPAAATITGGALRCLMQWMNGGIGWIGRLPGAVIEGVHLPLYGLACSYMVLGALLLWALCKWRRGPLLALGAMLLWAALHTVQGIRRLQQRKMIIYNIPGCSGIDFIAGRRVQFAGDSVLLQTGALFRRHLQPARLTMGVIPGGIGGYRRQGAFISLGTTRLVVIDSSWKARPIAKKFETDYVLFTHNPQVDIRQLKQQFAFRLLIFDASNASWRIRQWKSDCYALTLRCFSVPDQGAYVVNF